MRSYEATRWLFFTWLNVHSLSPSLHRLSTISSRYISLSANQHDERYFPATINVSSSKSHLTAESDCKLLAESLQKCPHHTCIWKVICLCEYFASGWWTIFYVMVDWWHFLMFFTCALKRFHMGNVCGFKCNPSGFQMLPHRFNMSIYVGFTCIPLGFT